jgi:CheY-like chemotaxis protein
VRAKRLTGCGRRWQLGGVLAGVPTSIDFSAFLRSIGGIVRARAEAKNLVFIVELLDPLPAVVRADQTRLRQVLLNLLGNAIKFTEHGSVTLRVSVVGGPQLVVSGESSAITTTDKPSALKTTDHGPLTTDMIRFEVIDTGVGISTADMARLFRPFEQVGDAWQRAEGTGLGLAISQRLAQRMGGYIQVRSQPGVGSAFWFDLVAPVAAEMPAKDSPERRTIVGYEGPRRTILIADDSTDNRSILVDLLVPLGFTVAEAADGATALARARELRPDAIPHGSANARYDWHSGGAGHSPA